uniref:Family with sequence similarity 237 member A n=1 Tax=Amphiprion ocellaris TaxID=80972 RepID=A0A3Q1CAW0_AMPOC
MVPVLLNKAVATVFVLSSICAVLLQGQKPGQVDPLTVPRANPQCWDSSSALLLEMRSPRIADTVPAFWEMMETLRSSDNDKHTTLFWDLARVFWNMYLDCVLSRSHGLGRRHITAVHSLTDSKPPPHSSFMRKITPRNEEKKKHLVLMVTGREKSRIKRETERHTNQKS